MPIDPSSPYTRLDPTRKQTRILQLVSSSRLRSGSASAQLTASPDILSFCVYVVSLANDNPVPFYDAISYSWGTDEEKTQTARIVLNGEQVTIPAKTEAALRALCDQHKHYSVWIDAVCLDLAAKDERNNQVELMGDIFSRANRVLVWYGNDKHSDGPLIRSVTRLLTLLDPTRADRLSGPSSSSNKSLRLRADPQKLAQFTEWSHLYSFFSNRWFTRAWVIQEVCRGKQVYCYQGSHMVDFTDIARIATYLSKRQDCLPRIPKRKVLTGIENASIMWTLKCHKADKLADLLRVVYTFECQIPHDMVYSILGLRDRSAQNPNSPTRIIPIYEEPILEVFAKATKAAIVEDGNLSLLKHAHSLRPVTEPNVKIDNFPTWALRIDLRGRYHINPISYRKFSFNADDKRPMVLWRDNSSRALRVKGVLFDTVLEVSEPMIWKQHDPKFKPADTLTAAAVLRDAYSWSCEILPTWSTEYLARKFSMTVAAGQDATGRKLFDTKGHADRLHYGFLNAVYAPSAQPTGDADDDVVSVHSSVSAATSRSVDMTDFDTDFDTDLAADNPDTTYALAAMMKGGHHRTVFVTKQGYLGLGTDNIQAGDVVCILFGGSVPLVLRPENHFWWFVGDAYVDDIMEGQHIHALKASNTLKEATKLFIIR